MATLLDTSTFDRELFYVRCILFNSISSILILSSKLLFSFINKKMPLYLVTTSFSLLHVLLLTTKFLQIFQRKILAFYFEMKLVLQFGKIVIINQFLNQTYLKMILRGFFFYEIEQLAQFSSHQNKQKKQIPLLTIF